MREMRTPFLLGIIVLSVLSRLMPHEPNFTPLGALALYSGTYLNGRIKPFLIPLGVLLVSDLFLGFYPEIGFVYAAFLLTVGLGFYLRKKRSIPRVGGIAIASAVLFFIISNFGVWAMGGIYPQSIHGLSACFVAGVPFFRATLVSTLAYTAAMFGAQEYLDRRVFKPSPAA